MTGHEMRQLRKETLNMSQTQLAFYVGRDKTSIAHAEQRNVGKVPEKLAEDVSNLTKSKQKPPTGGNL